MRISMMERLAARKAAVRRLSLSGACSMKLSMEAGDHDGQLNDANVGAEGERAGGVVQAEGAMRTATVVTSISRQARSLPHAWMSMRRVLAIS